MPLVATFFGPGGASIARLSDWLSARVILLFLAIFGIALHLHCFVLVWHLRKAVSLDYSSRFFAYFPKEEGARRHSFLHAMVRHPFYSGPHCE